MNTLKMIPIHIIVILIMCVPSWLIYDIIAVPTLHVPELDYLQFSGLMILARIVYSIVTAYIR